MRTSWLVGTIVSASLLAPATGQEPTPAARVPEVTIDFERTELRDVVQHLAAAGAANILVGSDVPENLLVSVRLRNIAWPDALQAVVRSVGMTLLREEGADLWIVRDPEKLRPETRVFRLAHLKPLVLRVGGESRTLVPVQLRDRAIDVIDEVRTALGAEPGASVNFDAEARTIVVTARRHRLVEIAGVLAALDVAPVLTSAPAPASAERPVHAALERLAALEAQLAALRRELEALRAR